MSESSQSDGLFAVSDGISRYLAACFGRGPARTRAFENDGYLFVVLEGAMVDAEHTLHTYGRPDAVRAFRQAFHDVTAAKLVGIVEEALRRDVVDHSSQILPDADVLVHIFALAR